MNRNTYAILVDCLNWDVVPKKLQLSPTVTVHHGNDNNVIKLYHKLCNENGLDDGEPLQYPTHFVIDEIIDHDYSIQYWGPYSTVSRLCNIIAICTNSILGHVRLILTWDNFTNAAATYVINPQIPLNEIFEYDDHRVPLKIDELINCWHNENRLERYSGNNDRLSIALSHFFYSWRAAHYYIPTCINLAISIEALFAPYSQSELSHQIAFNVCHFLGENAESREIIFKKIKKFYSLRSQIIHGSMPNEEKLYNHIPDIFRLICQIFKKILTNNENFSIFTNEDLRRKRFNEWLYN